MSFLLPVLYNVLFQKHGLKTASSMKVSFFNTSLHSVDFSSSSIEGIAVSQNMLEGAIVNSHQALEMAKLLGLVIKENA